MSAQQFQLMCLVRLGEVDKMPTNDAEIAMCTCGAGKPDISHLLTCRIAGNVTRRHNAVRDEITTVLKECHKTAIMEPSLEGVPGNTSRQYADIATYNVLADGGLTEFYDISMTSTYTAAAKGTTAGETAATRHKDKLKHYEAVIKAGGSLVVPLVWDTTGCPAPQGDVQRLIQRLGKHLYKPPAECLNWTAPTPTVALEQRLSVSVHRSVANALIHATCKGQPGLHRRSGHVVQRSLQLAQAEQVAQKQLPAGGRSHGAHGLGRRAHSQ
jgi:hypothetical protein